MSVGARQGESRLIGQTFQSLVAISVLADNIRRARRCKGERGSIATMCFSSGKSLEYTPDTAVEAWPPCAASTIVFEIAYQRRMSTFAPPLLPMSCRREELTFPTTRMLFHSHTPSCTASPSCLGPGASAAAPRSRLHCTPRRTCRGSSSSSSAGTPRARPRPQAQARMRGSRTRRS